MLSHLPKAPSQGRAGPAADFLAFLVFLGMYLRTAVGKQSPYEGSVKHKSVRILDSELCHQRKHGPLVDSLVDLRCQHWSAVKCPCLAWELCRSPP